MVGNQWQNYETDMFASYGTGLIDNTTGFTTDGSMLKNGVPVNSLNLVDALGGNLMDSLITTPNTRVRLNRNIYGQPNQYITRLSAFFGEGIRTWFILLIAIVLKEHLYSLHKTETIITLQEV